MFYDIIMWYFLAVSVAGLLSTCGGQPIALEIVCEICIGVLETFGQ